MKNISKAIIAILIVYGMLWYSNLPDYVGSRANANELINKGWIPDILPSTTYDIYEGHSLDVNIGSGKFKFKERELLSFKSELENASEGLLPTSNAEGIIRSYSDSYTSYLVYHTIWDGHALIVIDWSALKGAFYFDIRGYISNGPFSKP